jgi:uncharacterized protein (DUF885 family)
MVSAVFAVCDEYVSRYAELDPVYGRGRGIAGDFGAATDYGPDGIAARADLVRGTLARLDALAGAGTWSVAQGRSSDAGWSGDTGWSAGDRLAAAHLRERLSAELAWHELDEPLRLLPAVLGPLRAICGVVAEGRPAVEDESDWAGTLERLRAVPVMLASWRRALALGLERGLPAARRQAVETAARADRLAGTGSGDGTGGVHTALLAEYAGRYPDGPLAVPLARAADAAHAGYADLARYLRGDYAPRAAERDGVGARRYAVASRLALGADIDPLEAYDWAWSELHAIEAELAAEAARVPGCGGDVDAAFETLDATQYVEGCDAYRAWLQERLDEAVHRLDGALFDIEPPLRTVEARLVTVPGEVGAFYLPPDERLTRPGRTFWAVAGRSRFAVWAEHTSVCHEGVPGHHLQLGRVVMAGDRLSRFARAFGVSGHAEGWAVYAERLADELGWFSAPGARLGTLRIRARQAARVAIDIGLHLDLPVPAPDAARHGPQWTFEVARDVLATRGRCVEYRLTPEIVRYCGRPGQASGYKLGERAWLAAREQARARDGAAFDLRRWHAAALDLGPVGLGLLPSALRETTG